MPARPTATSVCPSRHGRPKVSLMMTATSTPSSAKRARMRRAEASQSGGKQHDAAAGTARALVDPAVGAHEAVVGLGDQHRPDHPHDALATRAAPARRPAGPCPTSSPTRWRTRMASRRRARRCGPRPWTRSSTSPRRHHRRRRRRPREINPARSSPGAISPAATSSLDLHRPERMGTSLRQVLSVYGGSVVREAPTCRTRRRPVSK